MSSSWGRVAIITPTWKRKSMLPALFEAFERQTFTDWTHVVVYADPDDLVPFSDVRIRALFFSGHPSGAAQRNTGASAVLDAKSRVEYVVFFDDDNKPMPNYLERFIHTLDSHPEARYVSCSMRDHDGRIYRGIDTSCFMYRKATVKPNWSDKVYENDREYVKQFMADPKAELIGDIHIDEILMNIGHASFGGLRDPNGHF